jgi:uncharacterized protein (TIGR03067 family)
MMIATPSQRWQAMGLLACAAVCVGLALKAGDATAAVVGQAPGAKDDVQMFKGSWEVAKLRKDGDDVPEEFVKSIKLTFSGTDVVFTIQDMEKKAKITIDSTKKPKHIDLRIEDAPDAAYGIFEFNGDTVKIHAADNKDQRPKDFTSEAQIMIVLKRADAPKDQKTDKKGSPKGRTSLVSFRPAQDKKDNKDSEIIQGTWHVESAVDDGMDLPDEIRDIVRFLVTGENIEIKLGDLTMKGKYKVDETKKPKTVDITMESGESMIGIYEMEKDKVKFCMAVKEKGVERPKEFKSPAGSGYKLVVLKRAPSDKKADGKQVEVPVVFVEEQGEKADKEQEMFQGTWQLTGFTGGGNKKDDSETAQFKLVFKGNTITITGKGDDKHGTFKLDSTKKPKHIDVFPEDGGPKKIEGIYELTGDSLKICGTEEGPRPTEFKSPDGSNTILVELKRVAAKKVEKKTPVTPVEQNAKSDPISGVWKLLSARGNGEDATREYIDAARLTMTFETDGTVDVKAAVKHEKGTFKIDRGAEPHQITFTVPEKNETVAGIYKIDNGKLVLCLPDVAANRDRPKSFSADKGTNQIMFILEQLQTAEQLAKERLDAVEGPDRKRNMKNLSAIGRALHAYHDNEKAFPAHAIYSKDNKTPLLSWRVAILPYLDEKVFAEFKLDEPWDSEHNKKLIAKMPKIYEPVGQASKSEGLTYYQVFTGKGSAFYGSKKLQMVKDFPDGTSNTVLVAEAKNPVIWTKPDDLVLPEKGEKMPELGGMFTGGMHLLFADGAVQWVRRDLDPMVLRAIVTPNGGELVDRRKLDQPAMAMKKDAK